MFNCDVHIIHMHSDMLSCPSGALMAASKCVVVQNRIVNTQSLAKLLMVSLVYAICIVA